MQSELTYSVDGLAFTVSFDRWDALQNDRARWNWCIRETQRHFGQTVPTGTVLAQGDDLTTVGELASEVKALQTLFVFLSAWAEAWQSGVSDSENSRIYPAHLLDRVDAATWDQIASSVLAAWGDD